MTESEPIYVKDLDLAKRYGVNRATIWRWVKNMKNFPKPKKLGPGCSRWYFPDILEYERLK